MPRTTETKPTALVNEPLEKRIAAMTAKMRDNETAIEGTKDRHAESRRIAADLAARGADEGETAKARLAVRAAADKIEELIDLRGGFQRLLDEMHDGIAAERSRVEMAYTDFVRGHRERIVKQILDGFEQMRKPLEELRALDGGAGNTFPTMSEAIRQSRLFDPETGEDLLAPIRQMDVVGNELFETTWARRQEVVRLAETEERVNKERRQRRAKAELAARDAKAAA